MHIPHWTDRITFKVTLLETEPAIWRRLVVPAVLRLSELHYALQTAFGWTDSHLHAFRVGTVRFCKPNTEDDILSVDEAAAEVGAICEIGSTFLYEYDFGDDWEHELRVEKMEMNHEDLSVVCVDGARACPPEDCGGAGGYEELLEVLGDPRHEEYPAMKRWVPKGFDPEALDLVKINRRLMPIGKRVATRRRFEMRAAKRRMRSR